MGGWLASLLRKEGHHIIIAVRDPDSPNQAGRGIGIEAASNIEAVKLADIVVLSVPIDVVESVAQEIAPAVRDGQAVIDISSVKTKTMATLHKHLPQAVPLGVHPLFGPGAKDVSGQNFIITPTDARETELSDKVRLWLEHRGAAVTIMSPAEHDRMMAIILGLAHFIAIVSGDALVNMADIRQSKAIAGVTYRALLTLIESVLSEDPDLYASIQVNLPDMATIEVQFCDRAREWAELISRGDGREFALRMTSLKNKLEKDDPAFGSAYQNLYKLIS
jgi:prephenate dehydrogenase